MSDVVCAGCGSGQRAGAPYCAVCGQEFPRTGRPVEISPDGPRGGVQQAFGQQAHGGGDPGDPVSMMHTGTTEPEHVTATQVPASYRQPPEEPAATPSFAHVGRRLVAHLIDGAIAGLLFGAVYGVGFAFVDLPAGVYTPEDPEFAAVLGSILTVLGVALAVLLGYGVFQLVWEGRAGRTVGHLMLGMRVQGADDGMPIGVGRAFLRYLVVAAGSLVLGIGQLVVLLSPLWDASGRKQGWHDKAAKAVVVDARARSTAAAAAPSATASQASAPRTPAPTTYPVVHPTPHQAELPTPAPTVPPAVGGLAGPSGAYGAGTYGAPAAAAPSPPVADSLITGVPGVTSDSPAPAPAVAPEATPDAAPQAPDAAPDALPSEHTSFGETRMQAPAQRQALSPAPVAAVELELESGARQTVDRLARIGRNPDAATGEEVLLIRIEDPSRSVSKNHADLGVDSAGLWLTDRGSTNGTVISAAGLPPRVAEPGARVRVPMGSTIHVGDRQVVVHPGRGA
ncbi:hypothetical protein GCM10009718_09050 [Isoptericola halotolerans]|uniref:RDD family membrane protein YckC n=1 Tax=Isoptericola halotolerans TaxID=300560 RepID=A0ABX1ZZZ4_9MICO|nr:RDD family protein [Isoptericola halotolerans]NOV96172.1 putative RDD family membrane protein YckC [Isoptericola halotolerans]